MSFQTYLILFLSCELKNNNNVAFYLCSSFQAESSGGVVGNWTISELFKSPMLTLTLTLVKDT